MGKVVPMSKVEGNWIVLDACVLVDTSIQVWRPVVESAYVARACAHLTIVSVSLRVALPTWPRLAQARGKCCITQTYRIEPWERILKLTKLDAQARLGKVENTTQINADTLARRSAHARQTQQHASTPEWTTCTHPAQFSCLPPCTWAPLFPLQYLVTCDTLHYEFCHMHMCCVGTCTTPHLSV